MILNKIIFIVITLTTFGLAQQVQIKATVSNNAPSLDEQFQYSVEISGNSTSLPEPSFPDLNAFYILTGPNTSSSIQIINGKMSSIKTYSFVLQAKKIGSVTIAAAKLNYKNQTISSRPITLKVGSANAPQKTQNTQTQSRKDPEISGQDLYIKTLVSNRDAYLGQQIVLTYRLYFRAQIRGYNFEKMPSNTGFWTEEFQMPRQPKVETEIVNGIQYNTAVLRRLAIFPTQSGKLTIEPMKVSMEAVVQAKRNRRSLFDSFFNDPFGRTVQKIVTTKPITIDVKALPAKGKPKNFSGAVGQFRFSAGVDKAETTVNQAISLKLKIQGSGNIQVAELPKVSIPSDIEKYDPKVSSSIKKDANIISGSKSAEIILIPRIPGDYQIKPIKFTFFNPISKKYKTIQSATIRLKVAEGSASPGISAKLQSGLSRQEVTLLGRDIRFIKAFSDFRDIHFRPYLSFYFWGALVLTLLLYMVFIVYDNRLALISSDESLARKTNAGKMATRQLALARKQINEKDKSVFYKSISAALQGFVRDKLNIELTEFSAQNVKKALGARGISIDIIREYQAVLDESDYRQFSGRGASVEEHQDLYNRAKAILTALGKWI